MPARDLDEQPDLPSWKDLGPRLGAAYDLFGNGKTAVKASVSRYVASQTVGFASQFNPLGGTITGGAFSGTGADTRTWSDPNGDRIVQFSELGPTSNPNFGSTFLSTLPSADVQKGWFKRGNNWEYSANVQHELLPRCRSASGISVGGSATTPTPMRCGWAPTTTRRIASPRPPIRGCRTADSRSAACSTSLPSARPLLAVDRIVDCADSGQRFQTWNGFDYTTSVRLRDKLLSPAARAAGERDGQLRDVRQSGPAVLRQHARPG